MKPIHVIAGLGATAIVALAGWYMYMSSTPTYERTYERGLPPAVAGSKAPAAEAAPAEPETPTEPAQPTADGDEAAPEAGADDPHPEDAADPPAEDDAPPSGAAE